MVQISDCFAYRGLIDIECCMDIAQHHIVLAIGQIPKPCVCLANSGSESFSIPSIHHHQAADTNHIGHHR